jgi:8-oxo-dGDP phosphatase
MPSPVDEFDPQRTISRTDRFRGLRWGIVTDDVELADGQRVTRDLQLHPGAVGILALDDQERVLLVRQYRHPVGCYLWEPPAGLLDAPHEAPVVTAQRELLEEAGLLADTWHVLADWFNSPGGSTEGFRCFLARGLRAAPGGRPERHAEETDLPAIWVTLDEAVAAVLAGDLHNPTAVAGILAAWAARARGWRDLRPADTEWPARGWLESSGRVWEPA